MPGSAASSRSVPPIQHSVPSDRTIAAIAEDGIYRPSRHLEQAKFEGRVPGGDYEGYVDAHVRRLEALRRAGIAERIDADQWRIPEDFESRATAYDAGRNRQASIRVVSTFDLEKQIGADGATWLDRRLVTPDASDLTPAGFGQQVREAMDQRREHHIAQGDATRQQNGRILYRRNLLANLREREVARVGAEMASSKACRSGRLPMAKISAASSPGPHIYRAASSPLSKRATSSLLSHGGQ
jgi:hypothetical protein